MGTNQLKAGVVLSYVSLLLANIISFLYTPFMLRMLGQSEFGLYSLVASTVAYLTLLDFGFGSAVIRFTAQLRSQGKQNEQYELFGMFLIFYTCIGVIAFIAGLSLYFNVDKLFSASMTADEVDKARIMMLLFVFNIAITFPLSIFGSIITAYENFVFQKLVNILRILLNPCIIIPMLLMGYKAVGMVVIITVLNIISLFLNFWYCFARLKIKIYFTNIDFGLIKEIAGYSFYIFLVIIVDKLYWNSGQFILGIVTNTTAVAIYAIAIQFQSYYLNFSMSISGVFLPRVTSMVTRNSSDKDLSDLFIRTGRIQFFIMSFLVSGFCLFGKAFIEIWAGIDYRDAYLMAIILIIPLSVPAIQNLGLIILQARNQLKFRSILYLIVAIISLVISIPLAKLYEGVGCAIGTSLALIVGNIVAMNIYYYKVIHIDIPGFWREIIRISWPVIIISGIGLLLNVFHPNDNILSLVGKILLFTLSYIPIVWFMGMNQYEKNLLRVPLIGVKSKIKFRLTKHD